MNNAFTDDLTKNYRANGVDYFVSKYSFSKGYVYSMASKLHLTRGPSKTKEDIPIVLDLYYNQRKPISYVMKAVCMGKSTVIRILKQYGTGGRSAIEASSDKYNCDESFFSKIDTPEKAYWFGFIAADGNLHNKKLQICLSKKDEGHLLKFCKRIGYDGPLCKDKTNLRLTIARIKIFNDLKKLGLEENKTFKINGRIFNRIPREFLADAILGYFDGDGCFSRIKGGKFLSFSIVGNRSFLLFFRRFFLSFGLPLSAPRRDKRTKQTFCVCLFINRDRAIKLFDVLYAEGRTKDFLSRKKERLNRVANG
jgi:hypothetical protein